MTMPEKEFWIEGDPRLHLQLWASPGSGQPMLLLHGMAGNSHWWDTTVSSLRAKSDPGGIGQIAGLDFRGHGDSGWSQARTYDMDGFISDIERFRRGLGWERMILAGHSLGARVALEYAARHPECLSSLIAVDFLSEFAFHPARKNKFERALHRRQPHYSTEERIIGHFRLEPAGTLLGERELRDLAGKCIRKTDEGFSWKFDWCALSFKYEPVWPILPGIQIPTLVIRGTDSEVMSKESFEQMLREIPGSRGAEIARAHHHVPLDTPGELAEEIYKFIGAIRQPA